MEGQEGSQPTKAETSTLSDSTAQLTEGQQTIRDRLSNLGKFTKPSNPETIQASQKLSNQEKLTYDEIRAKVAELEAQARVKMAYQGPSDMRHTDFSQDAEEVGAIDKEIKYWRGQLPPEPKTGPLTSRIVSRQTTSTPAPTPAGTPPSGGGK